MEQTPGRVAPGRVTDLIVLKQQGLDITCQVSFEILPVDFQHRDNHFKAFIFLCKYNGAVDGEEFSFRKCYARGCPHNLCPHVSQAVMIANRYLQRDYRRLKKAGLELEQRLFTLEGMLVKFARYKEEYGPPPAIHELFFQATQSQKATVETHLEFVPAVEHFANHKEKTVFLMADFVIDCDGKTSRYERTLACYQQDREGVEKHPGIEVANERLKLLYGEFEQASIEHQKKYFS